MPASTSVEIIYCFNLRKLMLSKIFLRSLNFLATISNDIDIDSFLIYKGKWQAVTKCVRKFCLRLVLKIKLS